jgi:hypothetical protein
MSTFVLGMKDISIVKIHRGVVIVGIIFASYSKSHNITIDDLSQVYVHTYAVLDALPTLKTFGVNSDDWRLLVNFCQSYVVSKIEHAREDELHAFTHTRSDSRQ